MESMDIKDQLALADRHVVDGERLVARQRKLVSGLRLGGHGAAVGRALLVQFEELLGQHRAHRERLQRELRRHAVE